MPKQRSKKSKAFAKGKGGARQQSNDVDAATETVEQRILRTVCDAYNGADGLEKLATDAGLQFLRPRKKVTVMIVGNHSAGKSSFINWYVSEHVQGTGVAVESQGFTIITSGRRKELAPLKGRGTLQNPNYKHLSPIRTEFGDKILEALETRVSASQAKRFPLVDFIDTPGLVDGNTEYPFPVNDVIEFFANHADLILIFLDPHGQALGKRTMDVVKRLNEVHYEKMRYFLTKADTIDKPSDLTKVICQITQNLCSHIKNTHGFNVPPIFIPMGANSKGVWYHQLYNETYIISQQHVAAVVICVYIICAETPECIYIIYR